MIQERLTSHGTLTYRSTESDGPALLMIHGNSTSHEVFQHQLTGRVGKDFHCIAFDLPGHGASDDAVDPNRTYNIQGYAAAAVELITELNIQQYTVFGWSLGGHIALEMLAQTDRLTGVMISGTPPIGQGKSAMQEGFTGDIEHSIASKQILSEDEIELFANNTCGANAPVEPFIEAAVRRCDGRARSLMIAKLACGVGQSQQSLAINSSVPLAIVNGADDAFIHNEFITSLPYNNLWDGKVHDLTGIGHAPFWESPEQFDPLLARFLNDVS